MSFFVYITCNFYEEVAIQILKFILVHNQYTSVKRNFG